MLSDEAVQPPQIKAPVEKLLKVIELGDEENALNRPAAAAAMKPCPENIARSCTELKRRGLSLYTAFS